MNTRATVVLAASTLALVLSGATLAESAAKLEKAHEKAEADLTLQPQHEKAESQLKSMDAKHEEKLEKAHEKAEADLKKVETK